MKNQRTRGSIRRPWRSSLDSLNQGSRFAYVVVCSLQCTSRDVRATFTACCPHRATQADRGRTAVDPALRVLPPGHTMSPPCASQAAAASRSIGCTRHTRSVVCPLLRHGTLAVPSGEPPAQRPAQACAARFSRQPCRAVCAGIAGSMQQTRLPRLAHNTRTFSLVPMSVRRIVRMRRCPASLAALALSTTSPSLAFSLPTGVRMRARLASCSFAASSARCRASHFAFMSAFLRL